MNNMLVKTAQLAMYLLAPYVKEDSIVLDGTMGNGNDTLKLAQMTGEKGKVFAFDIQKEAVDHTKELLNANSMNNVMLIQDSHANLESYIKSPIDAAIFNLGYLPGGNHEIATQPEETLKAVTSCLKHLKKDGAIAVVLYSGHPAGKKEKDLLVPWSAALPSEIFHTALIEMLNQSKQAPAILLITRKKEDIHEG